MWVFASRGTSSPSLPPYYLLQLEKGSATVADTGSTVSPVRSLRCQPSGGKDETAVDAGVKVPHFAGESVPCRAARLSSSGSCALHGEGLAVVDKSVENTRGQGNVVLKVRAQYL
jgi:hypothetical protein